MQNFILLTGVPGYLIGHRRLQVKCGGTLCLASWLWNVPRWSCPRQGGPQSRGWGPWHFCSITQPVYVSQFKKNMSATWSHIIIIIIIIIINWIYVALFKTLKDALQWNIYVYTHCSVLHTIYTMHMVAFGSLSERFWAVSLPDTPRLVSLVCPWRSGRCPTAPELRRCPGDLDRVRGQLRWSGAKWRGSVRSEIHFRESRKKGTLSHAWHRGGASWGWPLCCDCTVCTG